MGNGFLEMLCNFYIVILAVVLPLYTGGSYWQLGDVKYRLFRNLSLFCLALVLCGILAEGVGFYRKRWHGRGPGGQRNPVGMGNGFQGKERSGDPGRFRRSRGIFSPVDCCMLCYGCSAVLSALCSSYGATAWTGYREWYMGAVSQLLFVGIYFFASRCYQGARFPVYLWEGGFFLVMAVGLCNRLGLDPLGLMAVWNTGDWEYSHLLSTIGNINWFCGYCSVALAVPVAGYMKAASRARCGWLYVVSLLGLLLLCIQGSDGGLVCAAVCLGVGILWGQREDQVLGRTMLLAGGLFCSLPVYGRMAMALGEKAVRSLPADSVGISWIAWWGWWPVGAVCLVWYAAWRRLGRNHPVHPAGDRKEDLARVVWHLLRRLPLLAVCCGVMALLLVYALPLVTHYAAGVQTGSGKGSAMDVHWGSGRGGLWKAAVQGFLKGDWKQKALGAGPDCFADYIYGELGAGEWLGTEGRFAGAVYANAHNQWLNHLVNTGLLGLGSALAVYGAAARRYRRYLPVVLALAMYGIHSLVSFQQVLSTPLFFLMLGMGESYGRRMCGKAVEGEGQQHMHTKHQMQAFWHRLSRVCHAGDA